MTVESLLISAAAFIAVKFIGYRYAGKKLNHYYESLPEVNVNVFGFARTFLGVVAGAAITWIAPNTFLQWYVLLIPVRMIEWSVAIWWFYEKRLDSISPTRLLRYSSEGTAWSYVLDLPAVLSGVTVPGGMSTFC